MRQFRPVQPDNPKVLYNSRWVQYNAGNLVAGDMIRLVEGEIVLAICTVLGLGMDGADAFLVVAGNNGGDCWEPP